MDYTKTYDMIAGLLLFIDFEKAFDSLEWNFMFKCLEVFGFGPSLTRWVQTFYNNITSYIAAKYNNNSKMLEAKWAPLRDCNWLGI